MDRRQRNAQVSVSLIGAHDKTTGLGYRKVDPGDSDFAREKLPPQVAASSFSKILRIRSTFVGSQMFMKGVADFLFLDVNGRHHNMARGFFSELNDPFSQVGINNIDAVVFQIVVQATLFGQHRFTFHDPMCFVSS